jgi:hypothetical protein
LPNSQKSERVRSDENGGWGILVIRCWCEKSIRERDVWGAELSKCTARLRRASAYRFRSIFSKFWSGPNLNQNRCPWQDLNDRTTDGQAENSQHPF